MFQFNILDVLVSQCKDMTMNYENQIGLDVDLELALYCEHIYF